MDVVEAEQIVKMLEADQGKLVVIILAAGRASRMGGSHKLLAQFDGIPLVRKVAIEALSSNVGPVVVVTGHAAPEIERALLGLPLQLTYANDHASGMSRSLAAGIREAMAMDAHRAMIVLADMPAITAQMMQTLADVAYRCKAEQVVRASSAGKAGHPLILPAAFFPDVEELTGDIGARVLLQGADVTLVEIGESACIDIDTVADVMAAGGRIGWY